MEPRSVTAGHGWMWIVQGYALFRRSPAVWLFMLLALYFATKVLGAVPLLGIVFILFMPLFIVGFMQGCSDLERGGVLEPAHLLSGFRHNAAQLVTIGGISLVGNLAVAMIIVGLGGEAITGMSKTMAASGAPTPQAVEEMRTAMRSIGHALLIGTLLSLPLVMALWFAPLLVYFHDLGPLEAMKSSFLACMRNMGAMLIFGLVVLAGMFFAMPLSLAFKQYDLALLLVAPLALPGLYASYRDIFLAGRPPQTSPPDTPPAA